MRNHARQPDVAIVFEDRDILIVQKPAGLLTSTVPNERRPTLLAMVREHLAQSDARAKVGLIHRLDRDAAGLLVFSKNPPSYYELKRQFFHHDVVRQYLALVHGSPTPAEGSIDSYLVERADGTVYSTHQHGKGQRAITHYQTLAAGKTPLARSLVKVTLQTGRKHQIRAHLSERACPIVGDSLYGSSATDSPLCLMAAVLGFDHPRTGKSMRFELPAPRGWEKGLTRR